MVKTRQPATSPSCLPHLINLAQTYDTDCNTLHLLLLCSAWSSSCTQLSQRGDQHTACKHNSLAVCMGEVVFFFKPLPRYFSPQIASITSFQFLIKRKTASLGLSCTENVRETVSLLTFPCWKMFHSVEGFKSYFQGGTYPCHTLQHSELVSPAILLCDPIASFTWEAPASPSALVLYRTLAQFPSLLTLIINSCLVCICLQFSNCLS